MTRIYLPQALAVNETLIVPAKQMHHLVFVLRAKINDQIILFNGKGGEYNAIIKAIDKKNICLHITDFNPINRTSKLKLHLGQAIPKNTYLDTIIQKSCELGVWEISLLESERITVSTKQYMDKLSRLKRIAISACEQCGLNIIPKINPPIHFSDWVTMHTNQDNIIFTLDAMAQDKLPKISTDNLNILIGPEGGLTESEVKLAIANNFIPVTLGERVLRADTAAIVACGLVQNA